jgi:hypothetical protein
MHQGLEVLSSIAVELGKLDPRVPTALVEVQFLDEDGTVLWTGELAQALRNIADDIYWDETGNWEHASHARVSTIC